MAGGGEGPPSSSFPPSLPSLSSSKSILGRPPSSSVAPSSRSWANVLSKPKVNMVPEFSPVFQRDSFDKLKEANHDRVLLADAYCDRNRIRMQSSLYGKFLGKALPLDQVKMALSGAWKEFGSFSVADLPNGFYYFRCESPEMAEKLVWDGPWTISGLVLQLIPWRPNFQPAFERLSSAAVWVQFHHLPMELWIDDLIEDLASRIGRLIKIDELTLNIDRAKFARVCIEIDLSKPLQTALWVGPASDQALIVVTYERLPTFCFSCGCIGHASGSCGASSSNQIPCSPSSPFKSGFPEDRAEQNMQLDVVDLPSSSMPDQTLDLPSSSSEVIFGDWMVVNRRRRRGSGRFSTEQPRSAHPSSASATWKHPLKQDQHVEASLDPSFSRGRGGRRAHSSRAGYANWAPPRSDPEAFPSLPSQSNAPFSFPSVEVNPPLSPLRDSFLSEPIVASGPDVSSPLEVGAFNGSSSFAALNKGKAVVNQSFRSQATVSFSQPLLQNPSPSPSSLIPKLLSPPPLPSPPSSPPPIIMSSLSNAFLSPANLGAGRSVEGPDTSSGGHAAFVEQVVKAFCPSPGDRAPSDLGDSVAGDERESIPGSDSPEDLDEDLTFSKFQNDFRVSTKKDGRRSKMSKKKGRSSAPY